MQHFIKNILRKFAAQNWNMFYLLQKDLRFQITLLIAMTGLFCYQLFTAPVNFLLYDPTLPYAESLAQWVPQHQLVTRTAVLTLYLLQQLMIFAYFKRSNFAEQESILPCLAMAAFTVAGGTGTFFTPVTIANTAIIGMMLLNNDNETQHLKSRVLLEGILIGIGSLYDPTLLILVFAIIPFLHYNRLTKLRDFFVALIGVIIPYLYVSAYHFFTDDLSSYLSSYTQLSLQFPIFTATHPSVIALICTALCIISLIYVLVKLKIKFDHRVIPVRKRFGNVHFLFAFLFIITLLTNTPFPASLGYLFVPFAIYLAAFAPSSRLSLSKEVVLTLFFTAITLIGIGL